MSLSNATSRTVGDDISDREWRLIITILLSWYDADRMDDADYQIMDLVDRIEDGLLSQ